MYGKYVKMGVNGTVVASATLPFSTLISTAAIRPQLLELTLGSDAAADNAFKMQIQRTSTAGTAGSNPTPALNDLADGAVVGIVGLLTFGAGPTLTANTILLNIGLNQRGTFRWAAVPPYGIKLPATANAGIAFMTPVVSAGFNLVQDFGWLE